MILVNPMVILLDMTTLSQGDNLGCVIDKKFQQIVSIQVEKVFFPILRIITH